MVNPCKIVSCLLAFGLVVPSLASCSRTAQTVTDTPLSLFEGWVEEGTDMNSEHTSLYNDANDLPKRTSTPEFAEAATFLGNSATVTVAANFALSIYEYIIGFIKSKADEISCTLTYGTVLGDGHVDGYAYEATITEIKCGTTWEKKTVVEAVKKCANNLSKAGTASGCCKFKHGGWRGHLHLSAEPVKYPVHDVTC